MQFRRNVIFFCVKDSDCTHVDDIDEATNLLYIELLISEQSKILTNINSLRKKYTSIVTSSHSTFYLRFIDTSAEGLFARM